MNVVRTRLAQRGQVLLLAVLSVLAVLQAPAFAATGNLSGRVSDGGGNSLAGAVIQIFNGPTQVAEATSGSDGNYSVDVDNGTYDIVVNPPVSSGFTVSHYNAFTVSGATNLNVVLVRAAVTFSGVFRTSKGVPIPNMHIELDGPSAVSTTTSSTGAFSFAVAPGTYAVQFDNCCPSATSDYPSYFTGYLPGVDLTVDVVRDLVLPISTARVTVVGPNGNPVPGAEVIPQGYAQPNAQLWAGGPTGGLNYYSYGAVTTGLDGTATLGILAHDPVTLRATPPVATALPSTTVIVDASADVDVTIQLPQPVLFSGVFRTSKGVPIPNMHIELDGPSAVSTTTSSTGAFSFAVAPGTYAVQFDNCCPSATSDYPSYFTGYLPGVDLTVDVVRDLVLPISTARVTVVGPNGNPVPGAEVIPQGYAQPNAQLWAGGPTGGLNYYSYGAVTTGLDGTATLGILAHDPVTLRATPPVATALPSTTVIVDASADVDVTIQLPQPVLFSGVFRTSKGVPIPNMHIELDGPSAVSTTTSSTGAFSFAVAPGTYAVQFDNCCPSATSDYPSYFTGYLPGVDLTVDVVRDLVLPISTARVTVVGPNGNPVPGAEVIPQGYAQPNAQLWAGGPTGGLNYYSYGAVTTGLDGTATLGILAHNPVTARVTPPASLHLSQAVITDLDARTDTNTVVILKIDTAAVTSIAVTPVDPHAPEGATKQFTATATYTDGSTQDITKGATWSSSATSVATVNANGLASAVTPGSATMRANVGSIFGQSVLTVDPRPLVSISVTPNEPAVARGGTAQFVATGTYSDGSTADLTNTVIWTSSNADIATITATGSAPAKARGTTTITAKLGVISTSTTMAVTPSPLTVRAPSFTFVYGEAIPATFTPTYEGLVLGDTQPATPATCTSNAHTGSGVGSYSITCSGAADPNYGILYGAAVVTVKPAPLVIQAPSGSGSYGTPSGPTYIGLVNGDPAPVTPPACTTPTLGTAPTTCAGAADPNYEITYVGGTLTITPAVLTVTAVDATKVSGQTTPALTATISGFVNGDGAASLTTQPTCTTTALTTSPAGRYPITCSGATAVNYTFTYLPGTLTVTPGDSDLSVTQHDSADPVRWGTPVTYSLTVTNLGPADATGVVVSEAVTGSGTALSAAGPAGACAVTTSGATCPLGGIASGATKTLTVVVRPDAPGTIRATAHVAGDQRDPVTSNNDAAETTTVDKHPTALAYTGANGPIATGAPATLTAVLTDGPDPVSGRTVALTLGSGQTAQSCTATTGTTGGASCTVANVTQPLGPGSVSATFAGDALYLASSDSKATLLYAFVPGSGQGAFVVGDKSATGHVQFWGSQWSTLNALSAGPAPSAFKGFARDTAPTCGGTWATDPGNSAPPPGGPLPAYMGVIVTSSTTTSGSQISGTTAHIIVVKTETGYDAKVGHAGTGTVVATVC